MKYLALFVLAAACFAQSGNIIVGGRVTVSGNQGGLSLQSISTTATQAVIAYTAPTSGLVCSAEVSESPTYLPLIHDLDTTLFTASPAVNLDSRAGSITSGGSRQFVVGKRVAEKANDGRLYSRAMAALTLHYFRLTCGSYMLAGTFTTSNIGIGNTYNEPLPSDTSAATKPYTSAVGFYGHPEFTKWDPTDSSSRPETIIDPKTGIKLKRLMLPQDQPVNFAPAGDHAFNAATGGAWTNPGNAIADDGNAATYSGTGSAFLFISDSTFFVDPNMWGSSALNQLGYPVDYLSVSVKAWCSAGGCAGENNKIEACLTLNGTSCWPSNLTAKFQELALGTSTSPTITPLGTTCTAPVLACWTPAGYSPLTRVDLMNGGALGWLVRKKTATTDQINIQYAKYTFGTSLLPDWPASGSSNLCSQTLTQNTVTGGFGYHCVIVSTGLSMLYWIDHTSGDANYLGFFKLPFVGGTDGYGGGFCSGARTLSGTTPTADETFYCSTDDNGTPSKRIIASCTLNSTNQPGNLNITCSNITPASTGKDLHTLVSGFTSGDTPIFNGSLFGCAIEGKQSAKLILNCRKSTQDTIGWSVVYDPTVVSSSAGCVGGGTAGCVVAAMSTWAKAPARWCVNHTPFISGPTDLVWTAGKYMADFGQAGDGPYVSNITSGSMSSATGAIAPGVGLCPSGTLRCDTVTVDGEPCDQSPATGEAAASSCPKNPSWAFLQNAAVGDIFQIESEWIVLANKSGNSWTFQRGYGFRGTATHSSTVLSAYCSSQDFTKDYTNWSWTWDSASDPHGTNVSGTTVKIAWDYDHPSPNPAQTIGGDAYWDIICVTQPCYAIRKTGALGDAPDTFVAAGPTFAGAIGTSKYFIQAEDHPGWLQTTATAPEKLSLLDGRPLQPNQEISDVASAVTGQLYKVVSTTSDGDNLTHVGGAGSPLATIGAINRKKQPTWAFCGAQPLIDMSNAVGTLIGTGSSDAFKYCVTRIAGECYAGSAQGDIYVNCPGQTVRAVGSFGCSSQTSNTLTDICLGNSSAYLNGISQVGFSTNDATGDLGRMLTNGLGRYKLIDGFWSAQSLPDASWVMFRSMYLGGAWTDILLGKLPPFPTSDGIARTTFVPVTITLATVGGATNGIVRFGYAENGPFDSFFCTSRLEGCVANAATVQAIPFQMQKSDGSGAETGITGLSCASGCSIALPGIGGRAIYFRKIWRDGSNATVQTGPVEMTFVP